MNEMHPSPAEWFRTILIAWWRHNARDFPWRETLDPYHVLIAEIMLRRTQARQVEPVFRNFVDQFPDIETLNLARDEDVLQILRPLGLHWRAPVFKKLAEQLVLDWNARIPSQREDLLSLPGIGEYVADAVRCFVFGYPATLIDTNTIRLGGRFLGFDHAGDVRRRRYVRAELERLTGNEGTRDLNLAMIDFSSKVCRPRLPNCPDCPLASKCSWYLEHAKGPEIRGN